MNNKLCEMCICKRVCGEKDNYKKYITEMQEIDKNIEVDSKEFLCKEFIKNNDSDVVQIMKVAEYFKNFTRKAPLIKEIYEKSLCIYGDRVKSYEELVDTLINEPLELSVQLLNDLRQYSEIQESIEDDYEEASDLYDIVLDIVEEVTEAYDAGELKDDINEEDILSKIFSLSRKMERMGCEQSEQLLKDLETLEEIIENEEILSIVFDRAKHSYKIIVLLMYHIGYKVYNYLNEKYTY